MRQNLRLFAACRGARASALQPSAQAGLGASRGSAMLSFMLRYFLYAAFVLCAGIASCTPPAAPVAEIPAACRGRAYAEITDRFSLIDHTGKRVTQENYRGKPTLYYLGFSYCPDICPMALQRLDSALTALGPDAARFNTVFISVDPERDTPEALAAYVATPAFPDGLQGLTGAPGEVEAAKKSFKSGATREPDPNSAAGFTIAHTSLVYLFDKEGRLKSFFPDSVGPDEMAQCLRAHLDGRL